MKFLVVVTPPSIYHVIFYMNTQLKDVLGFRGLCDLDFLFIVEILHDAQKRSVSTLISMSCQTFEVYPASSELVDMCTNL